MSKVDWQRLLDKEYGPQLKTEEEYWMDFWRMDLEYLTPERDVRDPDLSDEYEDDIYRRWTEDWRKKYEGDSYDSKYRNEWDELEWLDDGESEFNWLEDLVPQRELHLKSLSELLNPTLLQM